MRPWLSHHSTSSSDANSDSSSDGQRLPAHLLGPPPATRDPTQSHDVTEVVIASAGVPAGREERVALRALRVLCKVREDVPLGRVAHRGPPSATFPAPASFCRSPGASMQPGRPAARQRRPRVRGKLSWH
jgi:hypothetical protein